jgi:RNA polymerase sigma-B factor
MVNEIDLKVDINEAFATYLLEPSDVTLTKVVTSGEGLVRYYAKAYGGSYPHEDLYQTGMLGILKALNSFNQNGNVTLTWASWCIISEIRHFVRKEKKYYYPKQIEEMHEEFERLVTESGFANDGLDGEQFAEQTEPKPPSDKADDDNPTPKARTSKLQNMDEAKHTNTQNISFTLSVDDRIALEQAMNKLNEIQKKVINYLFFQELSQEQTAKAMGINQRKVSRIKVASLEVLHDILQGPNFVLINNSQSFKNVKEKRKNNARRASDKKTASVD